MCVFIVFVKRGLNIILCEELLYKLLMDEYLNNVIVLERYFILNLFYIEYEFNWLFNWLGFWLFININWFLCGWCYLLSCSYCWLICWSEIRKELFIFFKVWNKRLIFLRFVESLFIERICEINCICLKFCG